MQPTQHTIDEIFDTALALISTSVEAWSDLLAEDAIMEIPYAPAIGAPSRLEGKSDIYNHVQAGIAQMSNLTFTKIRKYPTTDPNVLWAEYHGEALVSATGRHYQQDYVTRIEIKNGKIVHLCDYFNPTATMYAFSNI
ncbi:MAG: nuclear transport factor 2 family protein [Waterburya sp.]